MDLVPLVEKLLLILTAGFVVAGACRRFGISVLVGYLVVGALISPYCLGLVTDVPDAPDGHGHGESHPGGQIQHLAEAGVFFLLFSIGLELSLNELVRMARRLLIAGGTQVVLVAVPAGLILHSAGLTAAAAGLLGTSVAFSSTVLVFKGLSEWGQTGTRHGRGAMGILLFQDISLVPLLLLIPLLTRSEGLDWGQVARTLGAALLFIAGIWYGRKLIAGLFIPHLASLRSTELLMLFSLTVLGGMTWLANKMGLPPAIGAFGAGLILSDNRLSSQIDALVLPFRETFSTIFFVSLGMLLDLRIFARELYLLIPFLTAILLWKTAAAAIALRLTGLGWRTGFGMGLCLFQLGEFAFVVGMAAQAAGLITSQDYQRLLALALTTLVLTPLLIPVGLRLAQRTGGGEKDARPDSVVLPRDLVGRQALVVGIGPVGKQVALRLRHLGTEVILNDLSPVNLYHFEQEGFRTTCGDAGDPEVLRRADGHLVPLAVICVPNDAAALRIVRGLRVINPGCRVVVRCRYQGNIQPLVQAGATAVVSEEQQASEALLKLLDLPEPDSSVSPVGPAERFLVSPDLSPVSPVSELPPAL